MNPPSPWRLSVVSQITIAGSVILTVVSAVFTSTEQSLTILVGLTGLSLTLLLEIITRVERRQHLVHRAFKVADALEQASLIADDLEHAINTGATILQKQPSALFRDAVQDAAGEFRVQLDRLNNGELKVNVSSGQVLSEETDRAQSSIRALSIAAVDEGWWRSEAGRQYWDANLAALKRKVKIQRIFITDGQPSSTMEDVVETQRQAGVKAYAVDRSTIPADLCANIVIFDNSLVYVIVETDDPRSPDRFLKSNPADVREAIRRFEGLLQRIDAFV
jgi:hypothetical protein